MIIKLIASAVVFAEFSPKRHVSWQEASAKQIMPWKRDTWDHISLNLSVQERKKKKMPPHPWQYVLQHGSVFFLDATGVERSVCLLAHHTL